jgi:hypothetical protein
VSRRRYRAADAWGEGALREAAYRVLYAAARLGRRRDVYTWPVVPRGDKPTIATAARHLGVRLVLGTPADSPLIVWENATRLSTEVSPGALNGRCRDIGKALVQSVFADVFGYAYAVDPMRHAGAMVVKSNENATHDGRVVGGPIPPEAVEPGMVYQRLIDGGTSAATFVEYRVPYVLGILPSVYVRHRRVADRFGSETVRSRVVTEVGSIFSDDEQARIVELCWRLGLDYGELDVLRDRHDGRIYVLDVNKTPVGPPKTLSMVAELRAMRIIARALDARWPPLAPGDAARHRARLTSTRRSGMSAP